MIFETESRVGQQNWGLRKGEDTAETYSSEIMDYSEGEESSWKGVQHLLEPLRQLKVRVIAFLATAQQDVTKPCRLEKLGVALEIWF